MANTTTISQDTILPAFQLKPVPSLIPGFPDGYLLIVLPIVTYYVWGGLWYWIEHKDYFAQYRIHTSAEVSKRNRVPLTVILQNVATQQLITTVLGVYLTGEPDSYGRETYDQVRWVLRLRNVQAAIPNLRAILGIDAVTLADKMGETLPSAVAIVHGMKSAAFSSQHSGPAGQIDASVSNFEFSVAWVVYWYLVPAFQFAVAIFLADSWQYFVHRMMHLNSWLYSMCSPHVPFDRQ